MGRLLRRVQVVDVVDEAAVVAEAAFDDRPVAADAVGTAVDRSRDRRVGDRVGDTGGVRRALVTYDDLEALVEERVLAETAGDGLERVLGRLEDRGARPVGRGGARLVGLLVTRQRACVL
jgi:hypothetical protein